MTLILKNFLRRSICQIFLISLMASGLAHAARINDGDLSVTIGQEYSEGDFGDVSQTYISATNFSIKYQTEQWVFRASSAWLHVTSPSSVTPDGDFVNTPSAIRKTTVEGQGDLNLSASFTLLDQEQSIIGLDVMGKVKIPTADEDKFLGTGELDYGLSMDVYQRYEDWVPYVTLGFKWRGDSPQVDYHNVLSGALGTDYYVNTQWRAGISYDWQERSTDFSDNIQEVTADINYLIDDDNKVNMFIFKGYSNASPAWGSGLSLTHYF